MKAIQIGILAALIVVAGLLFMVWRGQQHETTAMTPAVEPQAASAPAQEVAKAEPEAAQPEPVVVPARKPSPVPRLKAAPKAAAADASENAAQVAKAAPSEPVITPAPPVSRDVSAREVSRPASPVLTPELPPPPPRQVTLEPGALIPVRLSETLQSDRMQSGETFFATLDKPLVIDGFVIAERGARAEGRVVDIQQAGRIKGLAELGIQLVSFVTSDGQKVKIQTDTFRTQGPSTKGEDAKKVGVGAGLGAAIGAIAGGGKGAAIGAAIGGAAGGGAVAATRGKPAVVPVETRIDFRLNAPVTITEKAK
jgi:hypothetical protein